MGARQESSSTTSVINCPWGTLDSATQYSGAASVYIQQASTQSDPTTAFPISFAVEFSKKIDPATFNTADITQTGTATSVNWTVTKKQ